MKLTLIKILGLVLTIACWIWARNAHLSQSGTLLLLIAAPLLQFPITLFGRSLLDHQPAASRAQWISLFVHYAMMITLGVSLFPAIRIIQTRSAHAFVLPIPILLGQVLLWITSIATLLTVLNLAIRGLGAPFAAVLSSRLATDWMYAWTRNPMVLCTFLLLLSIGLRYRSLWFLLWILLIVTPGWLFFVKNYEERELEIRFGPSYLTYKARTPFLWPRRPRQQDEKAELVAVL